MSVTRVLKLKTGIKRGSKTVTEFTLREPTVKALSGLEIFSVVRGDVESLAVLLPRISDITEAEIKKFNFMQIAQVARELQYFLEE